MTRLLFGLAVAAVVLTVYALVDAAFFDRNRIRGLPRYAWILIILFLPVIGALMWLVVGRGRRGSSPRGARTVAPDDDLEFLAGLGRDAEQEQRIRKLEQELSDLDGGTGRPMNGAPDARGTAGSKPTGASGAAGASGASGSTGDAAVAPDADPREPGAADESGDAPGAPGSRDA